MLSIFGLRVQDFRVEVEGTRLQGAIIHIKLRLNYGHAPDPKRRKSPGPDYPKQDLRVHPKFQGFRIVLSPPPHSTTYPCLWGPPQ